METQIELKNYGFTYRGAKTKALDDVSFSVYKGEFLSIIGPTGAGKTTICRGIVGLTPSIFDGKPEGEIFIKGKPMSEYPLEQLTSVVGYVHQDAEGQILMTKVEKEIIFPLENMAVPVEEIHDRLEKVLKLVHLEEYRDRHPFYLSGGQRQRVVLATALAMNPDVLIFDEAVSEIDPLGAEEIMTVAHELNSLGKTIIFIEHNMEEIARFADRIIVLDEGKKLAEGKTEDILTNEEIIQKLHVYPPQVTQLFVALKKRGYSFDHIPIKLEEAEEMLAQLLKSKSSQENEG